MRLKAAVASRNIVQDGDYGIGKEPEEEKFLPKEQSPSVNVKSGMRKSCS